MNPADLPTAVLTVLRGQPHGVDRSTLNHRFSAVADSSIHVNKALQALKTGGLAVMKNGLWYATTTPETEKTKAMPAPKKPGGTKPAPNPASPDTAEAIRAAIDVRARTLAADDPVLQHLHAALDAAFPAPNKDTA